MNDIRSQVRADHLKAAKQRCWRGRSSPTEGEGRSALLSECEQEEPPPKSSAADSTCRLEDEHEARREHSRGRVAGTEEVSSALRRLNPSFLDPGGRNRT